jgi:hypothetical protein
MVNSVFSSSTIYYTWTLKLHKGVIDQLDKYKRHCLWRGSDLNSKKPAKAAWPLVCTPKKQGGLGVLDLHTHNEAMLLKFPLKFFSQANIQWVKLVWAKYYNDGKLLTDKRRIPLRSASVRTPHLFHHGIPKVLVNPRSKGITSVRSTTTH